MHNNRFRRSNDRAAMPPLYPMPHAFHYPPPHVYHHHNQFLPHNFQPVPPIVTPKHESLPKDCFHVHQQFQHILSTIENQHINAYSQMHDYYSALNKDVKLKISEIALPNSVELVLHVHGNEFRHLITKLPHFGTKILQQMPIIHRDTGCQISFCDRFVSGSFDINQVKFVGGVQVVNGVLTEFLDLLPLHIGIHLDDLKNELKSCDLRNTLTQWMEDGTYGFTEISFHLVKDAKLKENSQYSYVVFRAPREKPDYLSDAACAFSELALKKALTDQFSAGYRLPNEDRLWYVGLPDGELVLSICEASGTTIKYSNCTSSFDFSIFGKPESIIQADKLLKQIAKVSLRFDIEDEDLKKPFQCNPNIVNHMHPENLVLITYAKSKFQIQSAVDEGPVKIRHFITLSTSYENRRMLFQTRRELLKSSLTENEPLDESELNPEALKFGDHLRVIICEISTQI